MSKKMQQLIWLDPITNANLSQLYVKSGAAEHMAINQFIAKLLSILTSDEELTKRILEQLYSTTPSLKAYSFFFEKTKVYACPSEGCNAEFSNILEFRKHVLMFHKGMVIFKGGV